MEQVSKLSRNIEEACGLLQTLDKVGADLNLAASWIVDCLARGGKILACGNGGSAAEAGHLTTELVSRFDGDRPPHAAINLCSHGGDLTAIGNDYEFNEIFSRQVDAFGRKGDVLIAFSTSGHSENVRRALLMAKSRQMRTIAFLGRNGGKCKAAAGLVLVVGHAKTARIQECHQFLMHTLCELVEPSLKEMAPAIHPESRCPFQVNPSGAQPSLETK